MDEITNSLKRELKAKKKAGVEAVTIERILSYIEVLEDQPAEKDPEGESEREHRRKKELVEFEGEVRWMCDARLKLFDSTITSAHAVGRVLLVINGGAAIAILAFLSRLASAQPEAISQFSAPLSSFSFGVVSAALLAGLTYLTQLTYSNTHIKSKLLPLLARSLHVGAFASATASVFFFAFGLFTMHELFTTFEFES